MKYTPTKYLAAVAGLAALAGTASPRAGELSGSLSFDLNSHFISYGFDVWQNGDSVGPTFNPSLSIDYAIDDKWTLSTGFWLDINEQAGGDTTAGGWETKETDTWLGISYDAGCATLSATYQDWQYAGVSEKIVDLAVSFDAMFSPSITWHNRVSAGASGGFNGSFLVFAAEHGIDVSDSFSLTIPVSIGVAVADFHTTETGYGFASIGLQGSYAVTDQVSINAGITYYDTDEGVVGNEAAGGEESFLTYNLGVSYSF